MLPFGEKPSLIAYQYDRLSEVCDEVVVVTKGDKLDRFPWRIIKDDSQIYSPMVGLVAVLSTLDAQKVLVVAADTPFVAPQTLQKLCEMADPKDDVTVLQTGDKIHPLCAVYDKRVINGLKRCIDANTHKMTLFLASLSTHYVQEGDIEELANLNTPDEYNLANKRIQQCN